MTSLCSNEETIPYFLNPSKPENWTIVVVAVFSALARHHPPYCLWLALQPPSYIYLTNLNSICPTKATSTIQLDAVGMVVKRLTVWRKKIGPLGLQTLQWMVRTREDWEVAIRNAIYANKWVHTGHPALHRCLQESLLCAESWPESLPSGIWAARAAEGSGRSCGSKTAACGWHGRAGSGRAAGRRAWPCTRSSCPEGAAVTRRRAALWLAFWNFVLKFHTTWGIFI